MGNEAIVIPIIIDPKAGVAGLKAVGEQAQKTNAQMGGLSSGTDKFGKSMAGAARNALTMFGAMSVATLAVKSLVEGLIDAFTGSNKLASSTKLLATAQAEAAASTKKEVVELQTLYAVAKDTTLTYSERNAAIEKMNKAYPELHKNLTLETIGNNDVADSIQRVIDNMVKRAKAENILAQIVKYSNELDGLRDINNKISSGSFMADKINSAIRERIRLIEELTDKYKDLTAETLVAGSGGLANALKNSAKTLKDIKTDELRIKPQRVKVDMSSATDYDMIGGTPTIKETAPSSARAKNNLDASFIGRPVEQKEEIKKTLDEIYAKEIMMADAMSGIVTPAFESFFDAILNKQNAVDAFFQAMVQSIKQVIKQLISAVIQAGILSLLTGGAKSGGFSFGKALGKILGFAEGGLTTGPVSALVGEGRGTNAYNPEVVAPLDKLKRFFGNMVPAAAYWRPGSGMGTAQAVLNVPREVRLRGNGRELLGTMVLEQMSQSRTS